MPKLDKKIYIMDIALPRDIDTKLKELNYKGPFLIEMWTEKSDDPIAEVKKAKEWMLERMKEGGFI